MASRSKRIGFSEARGAISNVDSKAAYERQTEPSEAEILAARLVKLLSDERTSSVLIHATLDEDDPSCTVTVMGDNRQSVTRARLVEAMAAAAGEELTRICRKCDPCGLRPKPATQFSRNSHYCKKCERKRVKEYTAKKRAKSKPRIGTVPSEN